MSPRLGQAAGMERRRHFHEVLRQTTHGKLWDEGREGEGGVPSYSQVTRTNPQWEEIPGRNRVGLVVFVWGDPGLEGVGLGFGSSLPVLPGVGAMLRLTRSLCPPSPPVPPSAELSPPVGRLYFLGATAPVQGGPGWLQRQKGQGLGSASPSPQPVPQPRRQQTPGFLSAGSLVQGAQLDCTLLSPHTLLLLPAPLGTSSSGTFSASQLRAQGPALTFSQGPLRSRIHYIFTPSEAPSTSASLQGTSLALSKPQFLHLLRGFVVPS